MRPALRLCTWGAAAVLAFAAPGCGGGTAAVSGQAALDREAAEGAIPADLVSQTWVMKATDQAVLTSFSANPGWNRLVGKRDYKSAAMQLGAVGGLTGARIHVDTADMYRQAALLAANSLIQTYGNTPYDTDPVGTAHLLTVAYAINGDLDKARAASAKLDTPEGAAAIDDTVRAWHAPWKAWLASGAAWPPDLKGLPMNLPEHAAGEWPEPPEVPHYSLVEQVAVTEGSPPKIDVSDPGALVALALWHDAVATQLAGDQAPVVALYAARYRLPVESVPSGDADIPIELLFGSELLTPGDAAYMAAAFGKRDRAPHRAGSLIASLEELARVDGKIDAERANDLAAAVRKRLIDDQKAIEGTTTGTHRTFADIALVGVLRNLAFLAELDGNRDTSGVLRINAMEKSTETWTACPIASLSLSAWDASNRYPLRPTEKLHHLIARYPSLETARFSLGALALRVSRETPGGTPGN
jgi:hypothetical protein